MLISLKWFIIKPVHHVYLLPYEIQFLYELRLYSFTANLNSYFVWTTFDQFRYPRAGILKNHSNFKHPIKVTDCSKFLQTKQ